jgi:hypothetical protein
MKMIEMKTLKTAEMNMTKMNRSVASVEMSTISRQLSSFNFGFMISLL